MGQQISESGRSDTEIRTRIEIARQSFINMKSVLTSRKLKIETKKRLIRCFDSFCPHFYMHLKHGQ